MATVRGYLPDADRYDALPYVDYVHPDAHPSHLATMAALLGQPCRSVNGARVLDIGCAGGRQLIAIAEAYPEVTCVGIDVSSRQIASARALAATLGLGNVTFEAKSVEDLDAAGEPPFDFILCQGVYSWVTAPVREAILRRVKALLHPDGMAFLGVNLMPGWALGMPVRAFLQLHVDASETPDKQIAVAREALTLLVREAGTATPATAALVAEAERALRADTGYLFHEYLCPTNDAFYRVDLLAALEAEGLTLLADADLQQLAPPRIMASLDAMKMRRFLGGALVHRRAGRRIEVSPDVLLSLFWSTDLTRSQDIDLPALRTASPLVLNRPGGTTVTVQRPAEKAMLTLLSMREGFPLAGQLLVEGARNLAGEATLQSVLTLMETGSVRPHLEAPRCIDTAYLRPIASGLAREEARRSEPVTTRRLRQLTLDPFERSVLALLDGAHDRDALWKKLGGDTAAMRAKCEAALDLFGAHGLLVG